MGESTLSAVNWWSTLAGGPLATSTGQDAVACKPS